MSVDNGRVQASINAWWDSLVSGVVGKIALMSIVPMTVYATSRVSALNDAAVDRHEELKGQISALSEALMQVKYKQSELVRHVVVIERKVLGYSALDNASELGSVPGIIYDGDRLGERLVVPGGVPLNNPPRDRRDPPDRKHTDQAIQDRERRKLGVVQGTR